MLTQEQEKLVDEIENTICDLCWSYQEWGCFEREMYRKCPECSKALLHIRQELSRLNLDKDLLKDKLDKHGKYSSWVEIDLSK